MFFRSTRGFRTRSEMKSYWIVATLVGIVSGELVAVSQRAHTSLPSPLLFCADCSFSCLC